MAVIKYNTADGGTNSTAVTVANSGGASGDAWGNVFGGTNVWTYSNVRSVKGGVAYRCDQASGVAAGLQMDFASAQTTHYGRCYVYLTAFASGEHPVVRAYVPGFANEAWRIAINASGQIRVRDAAATLLTTSSQTITTNSWWRIEWKVVSGTGTSGQITVRVYSGDLTSPAITYTNNACNTGISTNYIHFGNSLTSPQVPTFYLDEITTDTAVFPGPANAVNQPPTANAGSDQTVIEGSIVTLDASGSNDSDGSIASYAWTQTSGTAITLSSSSVAKPTFTAPAAPATLAFQVTVTDNNGLTGTDTVTITVGSALLRFNKAEGGSNGTAVTVANSGGASGDAWNDVSGTNAWTFSTTNKARGSLGYQCTQAGGSAATLMWNLASLTELYGRCYYYFSGFAPATQVVLRAFTGGFVDESWRIEADTSGNVRIRDAATDLLSTSSQALLPGVWYRFEWHIICGTTTGAIEVKVYTADQNTPLYNYSNTACNTNTAMDYLQFGPGYSTTTLPTMYADELALSTDGWIGTAPGTPLNSPPTANAGPDQNVGAGSTVTLDGSASVDPDGSIASYAWSQTGGTAVTLSSSSVAKPTFTAPGSATTLTFSLTVTDNTGATASDTVTIHVLPSIILQNSAGGGTAGTVVTTANSGGASGNAWQSVNGGGAWTYASAHPARGSLGYQCDQITSTAAVLQWSLAAVTEHYGRIYMYWSGFAASADPFVRAFATGFSEAFRIEVNSAQKLVVRDGVGTARFTSTPSLSANTWYRIEWHAVSSATVGQIEVRAYIADQTTATISFSSTATLNLRAETSWIQFGPSFGLNPAAPRKWFDEMVIGSASGGWIGVAPGLPINQIPVANAGNDDTAEPHSTYKLQGSATDDGSITAWAWRQISGTSVSLSSPTAQNPSFTVPAVAGGDTLVFGLTVTDDRGTTSSEDTVTITALTPTVFYAQGGEWKA